MGKEEWYKLSRRDFRVSVSLQAGSSLHIHFIRDCFPDSNMNALKGKRSLNPASDSNECSTALRDEKL